MPAAGEAFENEVEEKQKKLDKSLGYIKQFVSEGELSDFEEKEEKVKMSFLRDIQNPINQKISEIHSFDFLSSLDQLDLPGKDNKIAENGIKELRFNSELFYRKVKLYYPISEENLIENLMWFSQRGIVGDLDLIHEVVKKTQYKSEETMYLLEETQIKICERDCKDLLDFFGLTSEELIRLINNTIRECEAIEHPDFKEAFDAENPSRVIEILETTRDILQDSYKSDDINEWLISSNKIFQGNTPKENLVKGKVFQVFYFLRRMEWS